MLSDDGATLTDVYTANGEVLMGTMRWQRELAEESDQERKRLEVGRRQQVLKLAAAELSARAAALDREVELNRFEVAALSGEETRRIDQLAVFRTDLRLRRSADQKSPAAKTEVAKP